MAIHKLKSALSALTHAERFELLVQLSFMVKPTRHDYRNLRRKESRRGRKAQFYKGAYLYQDGSIWGQR